MFPAPLLLTLLIVASPVTLVLDGPIVHGAVAAVAALSIAVVAVRIRPGEAGFLAGAVRPAVLVAAVPAIWMLVQLLPLSALGLAHPIWQSAAAALGRPLHGSISIDPGATLVCLAKYLSIMAIGVTAAAVAIDRQRAERILFSLVVAAVLVVLVSMAGRFGALPMLKESRLMSNTATDMAALGIILAAAGGLHIFERVKLRRADRGGAPVRFWPLFLCFLVALVLCSSAVVASAAKNAYFAASCGVATLIAATAIRRFSFGPWGYSAIVAVALVVAIAVVTLQPDSRSLGLTLAFANQSPAPLLALTRRVLLETSWAGTGAGTFAAILPVYRDIDELAAGSAAPTAAAAIAVEMGRPFLLACAVAALACAIVLIGRSRQRGRDSIYAATGASCVVAVTLLAFGNAGLFSTPISIAAAAVTGMAIAQSRSRTI